MEPNDQLRSMNLNMIRTNALILILRDYKGRNPISQDIIIDIIQQYRPQKRAEIQRKIQGIANPEMERG